MAMRERTATEMKQRAGTRKFVEIEQGQSGNLELLCFLKAVSQKEFVSRAIEAAVKPYESWLERIKELKTSYVTA